MKKNSRIFLALLLVLVIAASAFMLVACKKPEPKPVPGEWEEMETMSFVQHLVKGMKKAAAPGEAGYDGYNFNADVAASYKYSDAQSTIVYDLIFKMNLDTAFGKLTDDSKIVISLKKTENGAAPVEVFGFYYSSASAEGATEASKHMMYIRVGDTAIQFPSIPLKSFIKMIDARIKPNDGASLVADDDIALPEIVGTIIGMITGDTCEMKSDGTATRFTINLQDLTAMLVPLIQGINNDGFPGISEGVDLPSGLIDQVLGALVPNLKLDDFAGMLTEIPVVVDVQFNFAKTGAFTNAKATVAVKDFDFSIATPAPAVAETADGEWLINKQVKGFDLEVLISKFKFMTNEGGVGNFQAFPTDYAKFAQRNPINFEVKANLNFSDSAAVKTPQQGTLSVKANLNPLAAYILADATATRAQKEAVLGNLGYFQIIFKTKTGAGQTPETLFNVALGQFGSKDVKETSLYLQMQAGTLAAGKISVSFNIGETIDALMLMIPKMMNINANVANMSETQAAMDITDLLNGIITEDVIEQLFSLFLKPADIETVKTYVPMIKRILDKGLFIGVKENGNFAMDINLRLITDEVFALDAIKNLLKDLPFTVDTIQSLLFNTLLYGYDTVNLEFTSFASGVVTGANGMTRDNVQSSFFAGSAMALLDGKDQTDATVKKTVKQGEALYIAGDKIKLKYINTNGSINGALREYKVLDIKGYNAKAVVGTVQTVVVYVQTLFGLDGIMDLLGSFGINPDDLKILDKYPIGVSAITINVTTVA